jgi:hypothetical protein
MKTYLLVEGQSDLAFFRRLLPPEIQPQTTIVAVGERSNITSMARSLMVMKRRPVALVTDSDAVEKGAVEQRQQTLQELVGSASAGVPYKVILAVPEIESWFFVVPEVLERLSGQKLSPEQRELGELRPKEVLRQLFNNLGPLFADKLASALTEPEVKTLQETQPRKELIEFLAEQVRKKTEPQPV